MKLPKLRKLYCIKCKKHTEAKVTESKRKGLNSTHTLTRGSKVRSKAKGLRGKGNMGKLSRKAMGSRKMSGKKQSKKVDLRFECSVCKKKSIAGAGFRAKKVEFI